LHRPDTIRGCGPPAEVEKLPDLADCLQFASLATWLRVPLTLALNDGFRGGIDRPPHSPAPLDAVDILSREQVYAGPIVLNRRRTSPKGEARDVPSDTAFCRRGSMLQRGQSINVAVG
jgi:hypothetical protein